jgi:hypothetical protein
MWLQPLPGGQPLKIFDEVYSAEHVDGRYALARMRDRVTIDLMMVDSLEIGSF